MRTALKWTLIAALLVVGAGLVVGQTRLRNFWSTVRDKTTEKIDKMMDTRVVLENRMKAVQQEYPEKIANLKIQIRELDKLVASIEEDTKVYEEVVALCSEDLNTLEPKLELAERASDTGGYIAFKAQQYTYSDAMKEANEIAETRGEYQVKAAHGKKDAELLRTQREEMKKYLGAVEKEYQDFLSEAAKLKQEIDIVDRNEKLIALMEQNTDTQGWSPSKGNSSLQELKNRIEEAKIVQEESLKRLKVTPSSNQYEARARLNTQGK